MKTQREKNLEILKQWNGKFGIKSNVQKKIENTYYGLQNYDQLDDLIRWRELRLQRKPKYRPFENADEYKPHRDKWIMEKHNTNTKLRINYHTAIGIGMDSAYVDIFLTWKELFNDYQFEDGAPCGVKE